MSQKLAILLAAAAAAVLFPAAAAYAANPPGQLSESAFNLTQNRDAMAGAARANDLIQFTLVYQNTTGQTQTAALEDDVTDILYLSYLVDLGGGSLVGTTLKYPAVSLAAGQKFQVAFKIQVKSMPAGTLDLTMSNNFGNGLDIKVTPTGTVQGAFIAPKTGSGTDLVFVFAAAATLAFWARRRWSAARSRA